MLRLVFLAPVLCWILTARRGRFAVEVASALGLIAVGEFALSLGWVARGWAVTLTVCSATATVIILVFGLAHQRAADAAQPRRRSRRSLLGFVVTVVYCLLATVAIGAALLLFGTMGRPATVPSGDWLLPLPQGLVAVGDRDMGCSGGSSTFCTREIDVVGPQGMASADVVRRVRDHLESGEGWHLESDQDSWDTCRTAGRLLDRHQECVSVSDDRGRAVVQLEESDDW